jgi:hypothetical protein
MRLHVKPPRGHKPTICVTSSRKSRRGGNKMMKCVVPGAGTPGAHTRHMRMSRLVAVLPLVVAASCYRDTPAQTTLPEPQYVSGPPGGALDPGTAYGQYPSDPVDESDDQPVADRATPPATMTR